MLSIIEEKKIALGSLVLIIHGEQLKFRKGMEITDDGSNRFIVVDYDMTYIYYIDLFEDNLKKRKVYKIKYKDAKNWKKY